MARPSPPAPHRPPNHGSQGDKPLYPGLLAYLAGGGTPTQAVRSRAAGTAMSDGSPPAPASTSSVGRGGTSAHPHPPRGQSSAPHSPRSAQAVPLARGAARDSPAASAPARAPASGCARARPSQLSSHARRPARSAGRPSGDSARARAHHREWMTCQQGTMALFGHNGLSC